jgi:hypothetical protein
LYRFSYNEDGEVSGYLGMGKIFRPKKNRISLIKPTNYLMMKRGISKLGWQLKSATKDVLFSKILYPF